MARARRCRKGVSGRRPGPRQEAPRRPELALPRSPHPACDQRYPQRSSRPDGANAEETHMLEGDRSTGGPMTEPSSQWPEPMGYPLAQPNRPMQVSPTMRAASVDRERAVDVLKAGFAEGRLTQDEYNDRMAKAYAARTYGELAT